MHAGSVPRVLKRERRTFDKSPRDQREHVGRYKCNEKQQNGIPHPRPIDKALFDREGIQVDAVGEISSARPCERARKSDLRDVQKQVCSGEGRERREPWR